MTDNTSHPPGTPEPPPTPPVSEVAGAVAERLPVLAARLAPGTAAALGRVSARDDGGLGLRSAFGPETAATLRAPDPRPLPPAPPGLRRLVGFTPPRSPSPAEPAPLPDLATAHGHPATGPAPLPGFTTAHGHPATGPATLTGLAATGGRSVGHEAAARPGFATGGGRPTVDEPGALAGLRAVDRMLVERLAGALEGAVRAGSGLDLLAPPPGAVAIRSRGDGDVLHATARLELARPGLADLVLATARQVADRILPAPPTASGPDPRSGPDETGVAASHGATYLGLAVATAELLAGGAGPAGDADRVAAIVGLGIGTAAVLLARAAEPPAYREALLTRIRAEYPFPLVSAGVVRVDARFALRESPAPANPHFAGNGLVAVVDGGVLVRTAREHGGVFVAMEVLEAEPVGVEDGWEEIVEVSWQAAGGAGAVLGDGGRRTPPWPGDYRVRVHAQGAPSPLRTSPLSGPPVPATRSRSPKSGPKKVREKVRKCR